MIKQPGVSVGRLGKGSRVWGLTAWLFSQPPSHVLSLAALGRTVQERDSLALGLGVWRPFLRGAFFGPAVPAGCVGSWVKDTAGTGSRRGGRLGAEGNSKVSCPGGAVWWHSGQRTLQLGSIPLELGELRTCCFQARGLSPLTICFSLL